MKIRYEDLNKHFTAPKVISPFFNYQGRVPRKFKKKWKHILDIKFNDLNQNLWCIKCDFWKPDWKVIDDKYKTEENGYVKPIKKVEKFFKFLNFRKN